MDLILVTIRFVLIVIFTVAGLAKLRDRAGTAGTLTAFGMKEGWSVRLAVALSSAELVVAGGLLWTQTAWFAAWGAAFLLSIFLGGIIYNLAKGRKPACNCFGQLSPRPIGKFTVVRNLLLLGCAGVLLRAGAGSWAAGLAALAVVLARQTTFAMWAIALVGGLVAAQLYLTVHVLQQQGRMLKRLAAIDGDLEKSAADVLSTPIIAPGLPIGSQAPEFALQNLVGERVMLRSLVDADRPLLMLFMSPACGPCLALIPEVAHWMIDPQMPFEVVVISEGTVEENVAKGDSLDARMILLQADQEISHAYHAWGTPAAVAVGPDGRISSGVAQGADAIRTLIAEAKKNDGHLIPAPRPSHPAEASSGLAIGDLVPPMKFTGLDGATVKAENAAGGSVALLFWNPGCGFCQRMLDDLRAWDVNPPQDAPKLFVISTGSREENLAMGLRSTVVTDVESAAARAFAAGGTPIAVLIDSSGRVGSALAMGSEAVIALVGGRQVARV